MSARRLRLPRRRLALHLLLVAAVAVLIALLLLAATVQTGLVWKTVSSTGYGGWGIDLKGNLLFIGADYRVWVLDVTDRSHPHARGVWQTGPVPSGPYGFLRAVGPLIYYGNIDGLFSVLTVSPGRIDQLSHLRTNVTVNDLERVGNTVLLAGDTRIPGQYNPFGTVLGINVTNPQAPSELFRMWRPTPVISAAVQNDLLYLVTYGGDFEAWSLNSSGPALAWSLHLRDAGPYGAGLSAVDANTARGVVTVRDIAGAPGVFLINLSSPPAVAQFLSMPANPNGIVLTSDSAFVSMDNLNEPDRPVAICSIDAQGRLRLELTISFPGNLGKSLAVSPSENTIFALGEHDLTIATKVPTTLFESNSGVRWGFLFASVMLASVSAILVLSGDHLRGKLASLSPWTP